MSRARPSWPGMWGMFRQRADTCRSRSESGSNEEVADQLCEAVKAYGLPFMKKAADLRDLVETMQTVRFGMAEQLSYRIPVGLWLLSDAEKAKEFIATKLSEIGARGDPAALRNGP